MARSAGGHRGGALQTRVGPRGNQKMSSALKHRLSGEARPHLHAWSCLLLVCLIESPSSSQLPYRHMALSWRLQGLHCGHCCLVGCRGHCPIRWKKKVGHATVAASVVSRHPLCPRSERSEEKPLARGVHSS